MNNDVVIVGAGIAGLTAAAYLAKAGVKILLLEKEAKCGGLINSFEQDGFIYDGGIRATENSGVLFPMLKQLGLEIEFVKNKITLGIEDQVIHVSDKNSIQDYQDLLGHFYPENVDEIAEIINQIKKIMGYMEVQYSIDNPAFLDMKNDREYLLKEILPWMFRYILTVRKIEALNESVVDFLKRYTQNQSLLDIITQHFFRETPTSFALSYLSIYLDYYYPMGGTETLIKNMVAFIKKQNGLIQNNTQVVSIDPEQRILRDASGNSYGYQQMIWAADLKSLYNLIELEKVSQPGQKNIINEQRTALADKVGNDSVFTVYLAVDLDKDYFSEIASEHFFYTPKRVGQSAAGEIPETNDWKIIEAWLTDFYTLTTYEISIPVLRDSSLAPPGQTALIISVLFDYQLTKRIQDMGMYDEFKRFTEKTFIQILDGSIYPGIKDRILHQFSSTPLTIEKFTANTDGAITGWSFTNETIPAENRLLKIFSSTETPVNHIFKAGQWSFSPSGLPISILTGKLASDKTRKALRKAK